MKASDKPAKSSKRAKPAGPAPSGKAILQRAEALCKPYRITRGKDFRLRDHDPRDTGAFGKDGGEEDGRRVLEQARGALARLQDMLYAQNRYAVLVILQAMDAGGKDGIVKNVMSGINPQGVEVHSFKQPTDAELDHDFLWRCARVLPERGRIGIFNRSYYEEVLVVRVHPAILGRQRLPAGLVGKNVWEERFESIRSLEQHLARNGTLVLKFFLHMSRGEQRKQFLERIDDPDKNWKFSMGDVEERTHWDDYMRAYESAIRATATPHAPWYVVPADNKWYTRAVVSSAIVAALGSVDLHYPRLDNEAQSQLAAARARLLAERG